MKLDKDILKMSHRQRGQELARMRALIRTHKRRRNNGRCWRNDVILYERTLPEGAEGAGKMDRPEKILLRDCKRYIRGQQCDHKKRR